MSLHQLNAPLKQLRLSGILATLEVRNQQAIAEQWTYVEFLTRLVQDEVERRGQKQLDARIRRGNLQTTKTLTTFDFGFNPTISRQQVYDLASGEYLRAHRNVLICGQTGVGKSHLAQALAHEAARQGADVVFVTAHHLMGHINGGRADGSYERRLASYVRADLLVIDDFGLKPFPPTGSVDFYDVIHERYERASTVLTSNRAPDEWQELFDNPLLANAALDRLVHRATILTISGRSYRLTDHADGKGGPKPTTTTPATP